MNDPCYNMSLKFMYEGVARQTMTEGEPISLKVVEKVADREGTDPAELHPPLYTVIDTEALDSLFQSTASTVRANGTVEFQYHGYKIRVDGSGEVQLGEMITFNERAQPTEDAVGD